MRRALLAVPVAAVLALTAAGCGTDADAPAASSAGAVAVPSPADRGAPLLGGVLEDIGGTRVDLSRFRGRVVLVVNTASRCGNTPQFEGLEALYRANRAAGLTVLGFPSNDFRQELGSNGAVASFCRLNYGVTFPMFTRVAVTGDRAIPLYRRLAAASAPPDWNFSKYLLDRQGRFVRRFDAGVPPEDPGLAGTLTALLAEPSGASPT